MSTCVTSFTSQNSSVNNKVIDNKILEMDHSRKPSISKYHSNIQNDARKSYLKKVQVYLLILIFFRQLIVNKGVSLVRTCLVYMIDMSILSAMFFI